MNSSRAMTSSSQPLSHSSQAQAREMQQERQGPLDGELLDLYVALLIAVPLGWLLKSLWF